MRRFLALLALLLLASLPALAQVHGGGGGGGGGAPTGPAGGVLGGTYPNPGFASQATNTVLGNATSGSAAATALAVGGCSAAADALIWTTNTGFGCNTSITAAAVAVGGITGLGTGVGTWLATPSFSNLNSALTGDAVAGLAAVQTFSGAKTFGETHGTTYAPSYTTNNYTATTADCGKTLLMPTGTTPTVTLPNLNAACTIVVIQNSATQVTMQAASGGTLVSVNSYTKTKAQNAILFLTIIVPSASAATWDLAGDGA